MEAKYAPLILLAQLHAMPQDYQSKIFQFDGTGQYTAQQHVNKMTDYFELHEIDEVDVIMTLFAQTLARDVKKWFKYLPANHIVDLEAFHRLLLIDGRKRRILYKFDLNMKTLEELLMNQFRTIVLGSTTSIMLFQQTLNPHEI